MSDIGPSPATQETQDPAGENWADKATTALQTYFGFDTFREGQREVVVALLEGHSAAAVFPTGGGKSLCYQLPALLLPGLTLVVSPLIALMKDQIDALADRKIAALRLDSSLSASAYRDAVDRLRSGELRLLYVAPERFNNERFREMLGQLPISLFAVDEAHCISEWGHAFRPDYLKLARFADACGAERCLALTATAPPRVLTDICREFRVAPQHAIRTGFYRENLTLRCSNVDPDERDDRLVARLRDRPLGATIVYVTRQQTAEHVASMLSAQGFAARAYHAGMPAESRTEVQEWFLGSKDAIIAATIAFGMGIDKSNIRYIYHYNLPKSLENYSQEIGRAGRDGNDALCETFVCPDDLRTLENFAYGDTPDATAVHHFVEDIFRLPESFAVSVYQLAQSHDIRELVVRTLLTYLEIDGYLAGGTPIYGEYRFKPRVSSSQILSHFEGERRTFVEGLFRLARKSHIWFTLDIDQAAETLKQDRSRVVRAIDFLAEREWLDVKASRLQFRFRRGRMPDNLEDVAEGLVDRCFARQENDLLRLQQMMQWLHHDGCQTNALTSHFGETRETECGHCQWCLEQHPLDAREASEEDLAAMTSAWEAVASVRDEFPEVLNSPTALARFLCGLKSPQLTRAKLTRHTLFGALSDQPFASVLALA